MPTDINLTPLVINQMTSSQYSQASIPANELCFLTDENISADDIDDTTSINKFVTASDITTWNGKQDALVSGANIKTINNTSLLGSGNITISGGSSSYNVTPTETGGGYFKLSQTDIDYIRTNKPEILNVAKSTSTETFTLTYTDASNSVYFRSAGSLYAGGFTISINSATTPSTEIRYSSGIVQGTNDGTNWTSITINGTTKNIPSGGGSATDVQINSTSIVVSGVANIVTETAYNAITNKIATMSDINTILGDIETLLQGI